MPMPSRRTVLAAATLAFAPAAARAAFDLGPAVFKGPGGQTVEVENGEFQVPEDRADPKSRSIALRYVRFRSTAASPGRPLVYLAGGPGGSGIGTARGPRYPIFLALRAVGDVIAFDQRGTGASNAIPPIRPADASVVPLTREGLTAWYRAEVVRCFALWEEQRVAIRAYNTRESAHDLDDLRRHLGADKLDLWGISYGTHLAQAALKYHGDRIGRVALASLEGLDQTVKRPARIDDYLARVDALIGTDREARAAFPDLPALMRRVHERLDREPMTIPVAGGSRALGAFPLQMVAGGLIKNPSSLVRLPLLYAGVDAGAPAALAALGGMAGGLPTVSGMSDAMDLASGISKPRLAQVRAETKTAVLGDALNFPMPHILGAVPGIDLGADFRKPIRTRVPALLISGTLDGRTPLAEQAEVGEQFLDKRWITVENAGHDVLETSPEIARLLVDFFAGRSVESTTVRLPAPRFVLSA